MFSTDPRILVNDGPPLDGEVAVEQRLKVGITNSFLEIGARNGFDLADGVASLRLWHLERMVDFAVRSESSGYDIEWETQRRTAWWRANPAALSEWLRDSPGAD